MQTFPNERQPTDTFEFISGLMLMLPSLIRQCFISVLVCLVHALCEFDFSMIHFLTFYLSYTYVIGILYVFSQKFNFTRINF